MSYAFAAAGTAGHVHPALAVAETLVLDGVPAGDIVFFGGDRFEARAVPEAGFELVRLPLRGLQRRFTLENLRIPAVVRRAIAAASAAMLERNVGAVLATGSYVTVPVAWAARRISVPYFVQEQNAEAGLANRLASRWADDSFLAFETTGGLPGLHTGNPIRPGVLSPQPTSAEARRRYGLDASSLVIGVVGGTLGSAALNAAVAEFIRKWAGPPVSILHLVGSRFESEWIEAARGHPEWQVIGFEREMRYFYASIDLAISRAGGMVAELLATGTPSVLVPGGFGSRGHQAANADAAARAGAAVVLPETELDRLATTVAALLDDQARLQGMATAARAAGRPDAAEVIARQMRDAHDRVA